MRLSCLLILTLSLFPVESSSQTPDQSGSNREEDGDRSVVCTLRLTVNLISVEVDVVDENGNHVSGLQHQDFVIYDNRKKQEIQYFSEEKDPEREDSPARYMIGYYPPDDSQEGEYRSIRMRVRNSKRRGLTVGYYDSYYRVPFKQ